MATIRQLYVDDPEPCDRETLLKLLREELGLGALGTSIRKELSGAVKAAVHRGILYRANGDYHLDCRHIDHYGLDLLRQQFLAANGYTWTDRDEAIDNAARFLGFRKTGKRIRAAMNSALKSAQHRHEVETQDGMIRRI